MSNEYYTFYLNLSQFTIIKKKYQNFLIIKKNPNILFIIYKDEVRITCFYNGTCLVQGANIQKEINYIKKILSLSNNEKENQTQFLNHKNSFQDPIKNNDIQNNNVGIIGTDESGSGDVFGPLVVCAAFVMPKDIPFLKKIGVRDSKKLSEQQIKKIFILTSKKIDYCIKIVDNEKEYNFLIKSANLNKIKALCHNFVILKLLDKINQKAIIIMDQFTTIKSYFNYLQNEPKIYHSIRFETKAESKYLSVALASIIARYFFLKEINKLSHQIEIPLLLGASRKVDEQINHIYQKYNSNIFYKIAKCNFKNIKTYLK
ncbi:ribonuclease HIII [Candidatus Phytoplasma pini]|uniref:Ribonuclease n=1 Tax=Candidatus Phytoplasma pini TaxID=267362 RepID=A0A559KIV3_9MOLU|nr:ribonuclease HIII [Candidatus Phytoplasma pini]TVY12070.1 Ribonuclease HIII [Candidatus Phytoplasma pini]